MPPTLLHCLLFFSSSYLAILSVPGANFVVVSRASLQGRMAGMAATLGVASGAALAATATVCALCIIGRTRIGDDLPIARVLFGVLYGALLLRSGIGCLMVAWDGLPRVRGPGSLQADHGVAFRLGFVTAASNPMSIVFFISACGLLLTNVGVRGAVTSPVLVFVVASLWFWSICLLLSGRGTRRVYDRIRYPADIAIGLVLLGTGTWAVITAMRAYAA
ncbi:LysE family transporter [Xanthobacter sp. KR7-65]|uniref:LysE family transporter n=1 Tax=Xanthobacter sp. KR7-65 TaxID=3156612 RepID=UPI0032B4310C